MACIRCFGDSNTYGYDPRSYSGDRYPASVRWTDRLAAATGRPVLNLGQNGRRIPLAPTPLLSSAEPADLLIVMLGSNDLLQGLSADDTANRMAAFLSSTHYDCRQLLLITPPPLEAGTWVTDPQIIAASSRLSACYQALANRLSVPFADAGTWGIDLTYDGVHFSETGHRTFAAELQNKLKTLDI